LQQIGENGNLNNSSNADQGLSQNLGIQCYGPCWIYFCNFPAK